MRKGKSKNLHIAISRSSGLSSAFQAFIILRQHGSLILSLFAMMISTGLPELSSEKDLNYLRETLVSPISQFIHLIFSHIMWIFYLLCVRFRCWTCPRAGRESISEPSLTKHWPIRGKPPWTGRLIIFPAATTSDTVPSTARVDGNRFEEEVLVATREAGGQDMQETN